MYLSDEFDAVSADNEGGDLLVRPRLPLSDGVPRLTAKALPDEQLLDQMVNGP